ncbi:hypothetical protein Q4544_02660 [Cognatishimia sp. 1_MG-2023]|uniref:hypothetical protein n=1 Tax=Cognatishimia sp. 1_MG-2023 TaxID=3062642 RepID=UPI0026E2373E|nr:hypothetical protein [Cognatishimia sp. 1_MG-2023]MDO6725825.1 hypothetical protein [Cognatishimia sp. 1_MG-2023]
MAIVLFLFGSVLGLFGAILQLSLGVGGFGAALQTYLMISLGLPVVTLLATFLRFRSEGKHTSQFS